MGVEQTRGRLEQVAADRVPVLPDQQEAVVLVERDDADCPRVHDQITGDTVVSDQDVVGAHIPHGTGELGAASDDLMGIESVLDRATPAFIHLIAGPERRAPNR